MANRIKGGTDPKAFALFIEYLKTALETDDSENAVKINHLARQFRQLTDSLNEAAQERQKVFHAFGTRIYTRLPLFIMTFMIIYLIAKMIMTHLWGQGE